MQKSTHAFITAAVLAAGMSSSAVMAQSAAPAPAQQGAPTSQNAAPPQAPAIQPSDAQLEKFAGASQKVAVLADEYRPKLQAAKDDSARQTIYREADEKMVKVVRDDGLSVDEFNGIGQAVQQDPKLQQKLRAMAGSPAQTTQ
ncbi:MAG: DUF4168 domain-containing protein [Comamonadaceae bacterium]|nr:MAG: DUF4168 domain-containing protein [Comamonadaceae bacterium]